MSEIDSNSEKSYDSDDSDIDYIPGYTNVEATEVKDANTVNEPAALTSSLDPHTYQPYEGVPIASEEWVAAYRERQETQIEFEQKLQDRFDGKCIFGVCNTHYAFLPLVSQQVQMWWMWL